MFDVSVPGYTPNKYQKLDNLHRNTGKLLGGFCTLVSSHIAASIFGKKLAPMGTASSRGRGSGQALTMGGLLGGQLGGVETVAAIEVGILALLVAFCSICHSADTLPRYPKVS